ncbi:MAG: hypothetical protein GY847_21925 [Proteobacteria bacterium]|nr:hypothetical protein [Pseudomonadota bacterium]
MTTELIDKYDNERCYCRKLGHHLTFAYCRTTTESTICPEILNCWFEKLPVREFIESHYSPKEIEALFTHKQPKLTSLVELIAKAKERAGQ